MKDRALTPEQKRVIVDRIYDAWVRVPHQRFGQLISNSVKGPEFAARLYVVEDDVFAAWVEQFAEGKQ